MGLFVQASLAQIQIVPREKLESIANPVLAVQSEDLKFRNLRIEADSMSEDDGVKTFEYVFENVGSDTLKIGRLLTSCSCVTATCRKMTVAPGESSAISVRYNPKGHPGSFERRISVYLENGQAPVAILILAVTVSNGADLSGLYPVAIGGIRVRRAEVSFQRGVKAVERCIFVNVSGEPLKVECDDMFLPPCLSFSVEPEIVGTSREGEILITYDPSKGGEKDTMAVFLKGMGVPPRQAAIIVKMKK